MYEALAPPAEGEAPKPLSDPTSALEFCSKAALLFPLSAHFPKKGGAERVVGDGGGVPYERFEFDDVAEAFGRLQWIPGLSF